MALRAHIAFLIFLAVVAGMFAFAFWPLLSELRRIPF